MTEDRHTTSCKIMDCGKTKLLYSAFSGFN